ncbi:MAG: prefoldin subunit beta [Candidatus Brockarchaeota archaeon]|nr:prefoldin subunit beta [Candidatus Brockarchaeota archaeon]
MGTAEIPPQIQEQLARLQQMQQSLDALLLQKQQLELELSESESAVAELEKSAPGGDVYRQVGRILIKSDRDALLNELKERKELLTIRQTSLAKQEARLKEKLAELQAQLRERMGLQSSA